MEQTNSTVEEQENAKKPKTSSVTMKKPILYGICAALAVSLGCSGYFANSYLNTKNELDMASAGLEQAQTENSQLEKQRTTLLQESEDYSEHIETLQQQAESLEEKVLILNEEKEQLNDRLSTLEDSVATPQSYTIQTDGDTATFLSDVTIKGGNRVSDLMIRLTQLENDLSQIDASFTTASAEVDEALATYNIPSGTPVEGGIFSSGFNLTGDSSIGDGRVHKGVDFSTSSRLLPIQATAAGTVVTATFHPDFGYYVVIDHLNGYTTLYAHCSELTVSAGDKVKAGDIIGITGSTGISTGIHCHYEIQYNGSYVDPADYL